jgi:hypothetical protein
MMSARSELVTDAAIAIVATEGMRELTHRAVDELANLPIGSTSNVYRSREQLLIGISGRLSEKVHEMSGRASARADYLNALLSTGNHALHALTVILLDGSMPRSVQLAARATVDEITGTVQRLSPRSIETPGLIIGMLITQLVNGSRDASEIERFLSSVSSQKAAL